MIVSDKTELHGDIEEECSDKILTIPNLISLIRLLLIPVYLFLLFNVSNISAVIVFVLAAASDFVDGQVARRTHSVSNLGKLLDPAVDTLLMITGVLGIYALGRIPLWIVILIFAREVFLLIGGAILLKNFNIRVPVVYVGKVATTFLFTGIAAMLLYVPVFNGMGVLDISWLPGFDDSMTSWGIYLIYLGLILQISVTVYYCVQAVLRLRSRNSPVNK